MIKFVGGFFMRVIKINTPAYISAWHAITPQNTPDKTLINTRVYYLQKFLLPLYSTSVKLNYIQYSPSYICIHSLDYPWIDF